MPTKELSGLGETERHFMLPIGKPSVHAAISALSWEASCETEGNHISPKPTSAMAVKEAVKAYNRSLVYRYDHKGEKHGKGGKRAASSKRRQMNRRPHGTEPSNDQQRVSSIKRDGSSYAKSVRSFIKSVPASSDHSCDIPEHRKTGHDDSTRSKTVPRHKDHHSLDEEFQEADLAPQSDPVGSHDDLDEDNDEHGGLENSTFLQRWMDRQWSEQQQAHRSLRGVFHQQQQQLQEAHAKQLDQVQQQHQKETLDLKQRIMHLDSRLLQQSEELKEYHRQAENREKKNQHSSKAQQADIYRLRELVDMQERQMRAQAELIQRLNEDKGSQQREGDSQQGLAFVTGLSQALLELELLCHCPQDGGQQTTVDSGATVEIKTKHHVETVRGLRVREHA